MNQVDFSLLGDRLLLTIMAMAGFVSMCTSLQAATRPAAVRTGHVSTALSMGQVIFIITRFGNLFYLPLLGHFVDAATRAGNITKLIGQIQWIIVGAAAGAFAALLLLPSFIELVCRGVNSAYLRGVPRALLNLIRSPRAWRVFLGSARRPSLMGTRLFSLEGVPKTFLIANVIASSIWTVGALAAITVSGLNPQYKQTALLLSGLVNSFAAIAFSIWVDPQAAVVTDQADKGTRPARHVDIAAVHLVVGSLLGTLLGLVVFSPAVSLVTMATLAIGHSAAQMDSTMGWLIAGNAAILLLTGTVYSSRVSAVTTASRASALAIFNFFSLIARVGQQVYAPFVGAVTDTLTHRSSGEAVGPEALAKLETFYRGLIGGATIGCILSVLMIPTFVKVYEVMIRELNEKESLPAVLLKALNPLLWPRAFGLLAAPWKQHVSRQALAKLPKAFLWANVVVLAFITVGQIAAIYAGAALSPEVARTTTLLSPLINGIATITASLLVDPTCSILVDQAGKGQRSVEEIETMTFWLAMGTVAGTVISQIVFIPAAWAISQGALLLDAIL